MSKDIDVSEFYGENHKFLHNKLGAYLINELNLIHLREVGASSLDAIRSPIMAYNNNLGIYERMNRETLDKVIIAVIDDLKVNQRNEVIYYIKATAPIKTVATNNIIAFKNCLYDVDNDTRLERSPDIVVVKSCPRVIYDPAITANKYLDLYMNNLCGDDANMEQFIYEILGYCLLNGNQMQKFFIIVGEGGNGKSTFLKIITGVFGDSNISRLQLEDMDEKFRVGELFGKIINLGDDIEGGQIFKSAQLKKIVTGEPIMAESKGKDPFSFYPTVKLIFTSNKLPRISDTSTGMNDRIVVIPFVPRFRGNNNVVVDIDKKIAETGGHSCLINRMIEGVKRIIKNGMFTPCKSVQEATEQYLLDNDHIAQFVVAAECGEVEYSNFATFPDNSTNGVFSIDGLFTQVVYETYCQWARDNGYKPFNNGNFGKALLKHGYERAQIGLGRDRGKRRYVKSVTE